MTDTWIPSLCSMATHIELVGEGYKREMIANVSHY